MQAPSLETLPLGSSLLEKACETPFSEASIEGLLYQVLILFGTYAAIDFEISTSVDIFWIFFFHLISMSYL